MQLANAHGMHCSMAPSEEDRVSGRGFNSGHRSSLDVAPLFTDWKD